MGIEFRHHNLDVRFCRLKLNKAQFFILDTSATSTRVTDISRDRIYVCFIMSKYFFFAGDLFEIDVCL